MSESFSDSGPSRRPSAGPCHADPTQGPIHPPTLPSSGRAKLSVLSTFTPSTWPIKPTIVYANPLPLPANSTNLPVNHMPLDPDFVSLSCTTPDPTSAPLPPAILGDDWRTATDHSADYSTVSTTTIDPGTMPHNYPMSEVDVQIVTTRPMIAIEPDLISSSSPVPREGHTTVDFPLSPVSLTTTLAGGKERTTVGSVNTPPSVTDVNPHHTSPSTMFGQIAHPLAYPRHSSRTDPKMTTNPTLHTPDPLPLPDVLPPAGTVLEDDERTATDAVGDPPPALAISLDPTPPSPATLREGYLTTDSVQASPIHPTVALDSPHSTRSPATPHSHLPERFLGFGATTVAPDSSAPPNETPDLVKYTPKATNILDIPMATNAAPTFTHRDLKIGTGMPVAEECWLSFRTVLRVNGGPVLDCFSFEAAGFQFVQRIHYTYLHNRSPASSKIAVVWRRVCPILRHDLTLTTSPKVFVKGSWE